MDFIINISSHIITQMITDWNITNLTQIYDATKTYWIRRWSQLRRLLERDVTQRNSVLMNSYSLVCILHFVSAVIPYEIARNKEVQKSELGGCNVQKQPHMLRFHDRVQLSALIYTMHEALRGYCPWGWGVRPVNWIYRLWRHCP